jgi:hypothetical protein
MHPVTHSRTRKLAVAAASAAIASTPALAPASAAAATSAATPPLAQLPGALLQNGAAQAPLTIDLPSKLSKDSLRAAIIAASAVQRALGGQGLQVNAIEGPMPANVSGSVIAIDERPGAPSLALSKLANGQLELTIAGNGSGLLTAARVLSSGAITGLAGSSSTVPANIAKEIRKAPVFHSSALTPGTVSGNGTLSLTSTFTLPIDRTLDGNQPLDIALAYNNAKGGRVSVSLGTGDLGAFKIKGNGSLQRIKSFKLAQDPSLSADLVPGWWAQPGLNTVTLTAEPNPGSTGSAKLELLKGSKIHLKSEERNKSLQLGLWPFPIYDEHAWSHATVVINPYTSTTTLSELIAALSNTARITGIPADPQVAFNTLSKAQAQGNVILVGSAATAASNGRIPQLGMIMPTQPTLNGVLEEVKIAHGGVALLAYSARSLQPLGQGNHPGSVLGRAVMVDANGHPHTLAAGQPVPLFKSPRWPWLAPSAFLAFVALCWIGLRTRRARQRMVELPKFDAQVHGGGAA